LADPDYFNKMKNFFKTLVLIVFFLGNLYLLLPPPPELPPLPNSIKSNEPGDTVQIKGVSAYYTDLSRQEVVDFYTKNFSFSSWLKIPLITYRLNHPPERIREVLRPTQFSTYVEEIVHPLRGSLFVNGYEWDNDPFTAPSQRSKNIILVNGKVYQFKVTLFLQYAPWWQRIAVWWGISFCFYWLFLALEKVAAGFKKLI